MVDSQYFLSDRLDELSKDYDFILIDSPPNLGIYTRMALTAADYVVHYDPWWNPAVEDQATDRAHRIGQDKPVFVYKLIGENLFAVGFHGSLSTAPAPLEPRPAERGYDRAALSAVSRVPNRWA